ncbi:MAG: redoxin domain-containing protein [Anaerolineales bacterium]|jgi:peroxiredoxin
MGSLAKLGQAAPDFTLPDLDGKPHRLVEQRGRIVVINFWSATCPWTHKVDEVLAELRQTWGESVLLWLVVSGAKDSLEESRQAAQARRLSPVLKDPDHAVADVYGAVTTPHFFVVDGAGVLRYQGALDDTTFQQRTPTRTYLADAIQALRQGQAPDPAETASYGCILVRDVSPISPTGDS